MRIARVSVVLALILLVGCTPESTEGTMNAVSQEEETRSLDASAEDYVRLVLALGEHDPDYVDAYYGPASWREQVREEARSLEQIRTDSLVLQQTLERFEPGRDEMVGLRVRYLRRQLQALQARLDLLDGRKMTFDEESRALYDAVAPRHSAEYFDAILDELGGVLPGTGPVANRYTEFRNGFVIPPTRLDDVFNAAVQGCRDRTMQHLDLPDDESFTIEYVTDKPWSGYNWYQGGYRSLIQVNTDLPIFIDRAIDLACHEGYPGHHVYNVLLEKHLVNDRGWKEFTVYPLFSPQSLIAEGSANFGIEMAFPGHERVEFEKNRLFPLAGLDPAKAEQYYRIQELTGKLSYAGNEAARRYLDGEISAEEAADWLNRYSLMEPERAAQRVRFIEKYRSYVINYNLGKDLVRAWVETSGGAGDDSNRHWKVFGRLLSSPRLPSDLAGD